MKRPAPSASNCRSRSATLALFLAAGCLEPEKITSSMDAARMDLCEDSPMTQRKASTRFDFPQPFGPTTPVRPGSIRKSVGSTKDLKPSRRSRVSFMRWASPFFSLAHDRLRPSFACRRAPRLGETRAHDSLDRSGTCPARFGVGPENESDAPARATAVPKPAVVFHTFRESRKRYLAPCRQRHSELRRKNPCQPLR